MNKSRTEFLRNLNLKSFVLFFLVILCCSCKREAFLSAPEDNSPPSVPLNVAVYAAHDGVVGIDWSANQESDFKEYYIYRLVTGSNSWKKIDSTAENHYIDFPLSYDTFYTYCVSSVDKSWLESIRSSTVRGKPYNQNPPTSIYDITVNGVNSGVSRHIHLSWVPQMQDYDIKNYEIYRSENSNVTINTSSLIGTSDYPFYDDYNVVSSKPYYYKVISVDKGYLKSDYSPVVSSQILECPVLLYPADNATVKNLNKLQFECASAADAYKIVIQSNELYGTVAEFNVYSGNVNRTITYNLDPSIFTSYKKYYWRVIAYSGGSGEPNSFSPLYSFTFVAE